MLIPLSKIIRDFDMKIKGVLHIGAHFGEEYDDYKAQGVDNMIFFEPVKANFDKLIARKLPVVCHNIALGNEVGKREMFIESINDGQSCSLLEPNYHLIQYPSIKFDQKETVRIDKLDNVPFDRSQFNMINSDVQGFELEVFKGSAETLKTIDYIYTEVNFEEMYKDCALIMAVDYFLSMYGFKRVITESGPGTWGDALYIKQ